MSAALALVCALFPGLLAWGMGHRLIRLREDPALPERLVGQRTHVALATGASLGLLLFGAPAHALWAMPLAIAAVLVGGFPARKALFEEQWGLAAYLAHILRLSVAGIGFWILLAASPTIVNAVGFARWPVIGVLATVLVAWNARYADLYIWLVGASPLGRLDLEPRFASILDRATVTPPRLYRFGSPDGRLANALAFPSFRKPAVLFGETLMAFLERDELAAIFAHEVAHLEHFDRRRLRRLTLVLWAAIDLGVLAVPLSLVWFPDYSGTVTWVWPVILLWTLVLIMARHKAREAESDRRAVALCGDAEALVRALTKLHALARLPRRWSLDAERAATHPSLAHRIQAIRAAAGSGSRTLDAVDVRLAPGMVDSGERPWAAMGVARALMTFCRDLGRNLLAGLRVAVMRRVDLAAFHVSADHLVGLVVLNLALLLAVWGVPSDLWGYWILPRVSTSVSWVSLLLFAGYVMARFERERITALALPVVLLCIYPVFFAFSALWKLADVLDLLKGRPEVRHGLWYAYSRSSCSGSWQP